MRWLMLLMLGCGGTAAPATLADACLNLASLFCDRVQACGVLTDGLSNCRSANTRACCSGADCATPIVDCKSGNVCCVDSKCATMGVDRARADAVFGGCQDGIAALSCGEIAAGVMASACAPMAK